MFWRQHLNLRALTYNLPNISSIFTVSVFEKHLAIPTSHTFKFTRKKFFVIHNTNKDELSTTCNHKSRLCKYVCQHLRLHQYISASKPALDTRRPVEPVLWKGICYVYAISFLSSKCSAFPASLGHGQLQVLATPSSTLHNINTWILTTEIILSLAACSWGSYVGM